MLKEVKKSTKNELMQRVGQGQIELVPEVRIGPNKHGGREEKARS